MTLGLLHHHHHHHHQPTKEWPLNSAPAAELRHCVHCSAPLCLVLQLYCPPDPSAQPQPQPQRVLFLMACLSPHCPARRPGASPMRLIRATVAPGPRAAGHEDGDDHSGLRAATAALSLAPPSAGTAAAAAQGADDWGVASDDWGAAGAAAAADDWGAAGAGSAGAWGAGGSGSAGTRDLEARLAQRESGLLEQEAAAAEAERLAAEAAASAKRDAARALAHAAGPPPPEEAVAPHCGFEGWYLYFQQVRASAAAVLCRSIGAAVFCAMFC